RPGRRRPGPDGAHRMNDRTTSTPARTEAYPERVGGREGDALGAVVPDRETFRALAATQRVVPASGRPLPAEATPDQPSRRPTPPRTARATPPPARTEAYPERVGGREGDALGAVVPDRETFRALAATQRVVPVSVRLLADEDTPVSLYRRLTADGGTRGTFL